MRGSLIIGLYYASGAALLLGAAFWLAPLGLILAWPALAVGIVAGLPRPRAAVAASLLLTDPELTVDEIRQLVQQARPNARVAKAGRLLERYRDWLHDQGPPTELGAAPPDQVDRGRSARAISSRG